jgi:hypothetical protein
LCFDALIVAVKTRGNQYIDSFVEVDFENPPGPQGVVLVGLLVQHSHLHLQLVVERQHMGLVVYRHVHPSFPQLVNDILP